MISDFVTVERAIELLNDLAEQDPEAMEKFLCYGVPCNEEVVMKNDVIVQSVDPENIQRVGSEFLYGLMGIINGMFGHDHGVGPIQLNFIAVCPHRCDLEGTGAKMGDMCPVCGKKELVGQGLQRRPFGDIRKVIEQFKDQYVKGAPKA